MQLYTLKSKVLYIVLMDNIQLLLQVLKPHGSSIVRACRRKNEDKQIVLSKPYYIMFTNVKILQLTGK